MSGRGSLKDIGGGVLLTEKEKEVLLLIHPYTEGMSLGQAALKLHISRDAVKDRLKGIYKRVPWLHQDIMDKRKAMTRIKRSVRRPARFGDMSMIGNDGEHDTFHKEAIVRKF